MEIDLTKYLAKPDKTIKQHNEELLEAAEILYESGYIKKELYVLLVIICERHDYGKVSEAFQVRVQTEGMKMDIAKEMFHNVLSLYFLEQDLFNDIDDYYRAAYAIAYHHNYCDVFETIRKKKDLIQRQLEGFPIVEVTNKTLSGMARMSEGDSRTILLKGFLHKCDYSASGVYQVEYPADFLETGLAQFMKELQHENKKADWNPLQKFMLQCRGQNVMAVAETGMGKTEAGLLWTGNHKGFFILPLRTAINAIYDRIKDNLLQGKEYETKVGILHSNSLEHYMKNTAKDSEEELMEYYERGRNLSLPLNISTMDQMFDFVFKYQGYEMKLTTLSYSRIVIDEIQMYGPELLAYLIYGLERVVELGGKVAILTATLPPFVKKLLEKKIKFEQQVFLSDHVRHHVKVIDAKINADHIYRKFIENRNKGESNKVLVVCNTIRKAQEIYKALEEKCIQNGEGEFLNLLHSGFIRKERSKKETDIYQFGKTYDEHGQLVNKSGIWVATSLVEASLDIDFDYLFTEIQDLNSLFQRMGRCNRKGVKSIAEANCYVYAEIEARYIKGAKSGFIDETLYRLSRKAILTVDGLLSEQKKVELIDTWLTFDNLKRSSYMQEYRQTYNFIKGLRPGAMGKSDIDMRHILSEDVIPAKVYFDYESEIKKLEDEILAEESAVQKKKIKDRLYQYTVSIPRYHVQDYIKAAGRGDADSLPVIYIGKYEKIRGIDCGYDQYGFQAKKFKHVIHDPEFL